MPCRDRAALLRPSEPAAPANEHSPRWQVIVKTTTEYQQQKKKKSYVPGIKKLNIHLYDEMSEKMKVSRRLLIGGSKRCLKGTSGGFGC